MDISVDKIPDWEYRRMVGHIYEQVKAVHDNPAFIADYSAWLESGGMDKYPAPCEALMEVPS